MTITLVVESGAYRAQLEMADVPNNVSSNYLIAVIREALERPWEKD